MMESMQPTSLRFAAASRALAHAARDQGLAVLERSKNQLACWFDAADRLDHDVDLGVAHHRQCVTREHALVEFDFTRRRHVAHRNASHLKVEAGPGEHGGALRPDEFDECCADVAAAEHPDLE